MRQLPGFFINVIFATLSLGATLPKMHNFASAEAKAGFTSTCGMPGLA